MSEKSVKENEEDVEDASVSVNPSDEDDKKDSTDNSSSDSSKVEDNAALLLRIAELEKKNKELLEERDTFKNSIVINTSDVYANLQHLQANFAAKAAHGYEAMRSAVPGSGHYGFDLKPYMIAAAKSRGVKNITEGAIALAPPKKRQFAAACVMFMLLPMSLTISTLWLILSYSRPFLGVLLAIYMTYIFRDSAHSNGSKVSKYWKEHWFWRYLKDYFPILLIKQNPDTIFDPKQVYMFGYHPHGIISVGCFVNFCSDANKTSALFPGISIHPATLTSNFLIPFWREIILRVGAISVSASSLKNVLRKGPGNAVLVVPGGAAESLDAHPGTHSLTLKKRQGFFRIALQHGAGLVPIYSFGENDLYEQAPNDEGTMLRVVQNKLLKVMGFAMPFFSGAGGIPTLTTTHQTQ